MSERVIRTKEDADTIREDIKEVYDGYPSGDFDFEDFLDRLEDRELDLGTDLLSPAVQRIEEIVEELRG